MPSLYTHHSCQNIHLKSIPDSTGSPSSGTDHLTPLAHTTHTQRLLRCKRAAPPTVEVDALDTVRLAEQLLLGVAAGHGDLDALVVIHLHASAEQSRRDGTHCGGTTTRKENFEGG